MDYKRQVLVWSLLESFVQPINKMYLHRQLKLFKKFSLSRYQRIPFFRQIVPIVSNIRRK